MATFGARLRGVLCWAGLGLCGIVLLLLVAMLLRAYGTRPSSPAIGLREEQQQERQRRVEAAFSSRELEELKEVLQGAVRIQTVSFSPDNQNITALEEFEPYIYKAFPAVFSTSFIQHEIIGDYSHLFTIQGSNPQLQPYMLLAHIDVVPAYPDGWDVSDPFSAEERDGFIYGRGTLDNKNSVMVYKFISFWWDAELIGVAGVYEILCTIFMIKHGFNYTMWEEAVSFLSVCYSFQKHLTGFRIVFG